jgi:predicted metal-dependent phosphoesterase TrpH
MILKTNLHFHTKEDGKDVSYDIYKAINYAKAHNFDVLAYTSHKKFLFQEKYADYAAEKGILLIPGIEMNVKKRHIVVLNCDKNIKNVKNFQDLADYKKRYPQIFILAPHPFVFSYKSLFSNLLKNIDLFDAIEMTVFSNKIFNFNKKAAEIALKYKKPFIATSDTHFLENMEKGYALIDTVEKTPKAIFSAIGGGKFENKIDSMGLLSMLKYRIKLLLNILLNILI